MAKRDYSTSYLSKAVEETRKKEKEDYSKSYISTAANYERQQEEYKRLNDYAMSSNKVEDKQTKINNLISSNPYMSYDLDAMKKEYEDLLTQREKLSTPSVNNYSGGESLLSYSQLKNSTKDLDNEISQKSRAINVIERNQARTNYEVDALNDNDFDYYSQIGSSIKNPTRDEAEAGIHIGGAFGNNNDGIQIGGKKVNNIVTYSRENYDTLKTYDIDEPDTEGERKNFRNNVGDEKYHFMTNDEVNVYNYYLAKENAGLVEKGTAQKYLDAIDYELNSRVAQDMGDYVGDSSFLANIFGLTAGTESHYVGLGNAIDMYVNPDNVEVNPSALQLGDSVARENQGVLGKFNHDLISTTANMVPSIIASSAANLIIPGSGEVIGSAIMGASAAGNEYQNMLFQGYGHEAAKTDAELTGLSEAVMQYALGGIKALGGKGIEKILGKELKPITEGIKNATTRAIADYGIDMGKEALEEGVQEIVAPYIKAYATGEIPEDIDWENVFYSALLGGVNAGILNAGNIGKASYVPFDNIQQNTSSNFLNNGIGVNNENNTESKTNENVLGLPGMSTETEVTSPFTDDGNIETEAPSSNVEDTIDNSDKDLKTQIESLGHDKETNKAIEMGYDPELGIPVSDYVTGVEEGYRYGLVGYPLQQVRQDSTFASLPKSVQDFAYSLGKQAQKSKEVVPTTVSKSNVENAGTVRGEGVKINDLKEAFNDTQGLAYKLISFVAEAGENEVVLFKSEPNADGVYTAPQGMFKSGTNDNAIYIDLNAGLVRAGKVNTPDKLAKYTMFRTFGHEYTHFCQKWNPSGYNSFRTLIFETLNEMGENAEDLIEEEMLLNGTSYEKASNDVVAEAMSEIFMDERTAKSFGEKLYKKSKELFENFLKKLKEFIANLKAHFKILEKNPNNSKAANAVKKEVKGQIEYLDKIYEAYVDMSVGAAENYKNVLNKYRTAETKPVETETTVKEIDVNSLMNAVTEAQGKANETGEEQSVKLSDHEKKDNTSNEDNRVKELLDNAKKILEENGSTAVKIKLLDVPHEKSLQEKNAIKTAEKFNYELSVNSLALLSNDLQIDYKDTINGDFGLWVIENSSDWNKLDTDMKKHHDYMMEHYVDGDVNKGRLPGKDEDSKNVKSLTDYAKVLSEGNSEETNWYKTVTDPDVYGAYVNKPISYIKAASGYYRLGLYGESFDYNIDKDDFWSHFYAFHEMEISLSEETAKKIHEAGIKDREALTESAYTDEAPIHLGDNKSVFERVIKPFYHLFGVSEHSKTYGEDGMTPYDLVDISDKGNDLYVRFRDMPRKSNGREFDLKLADYKNYTAQEIIDSVDKAYGKDALGTNFTNGIKDYYKQYVKAEKPKKESKPAKTVKKPSVVTGDIDFKATKAIAEKIVKQTKKDNETVGMSDGKVFFAGNKHLVVRVDEAAYKEIESGEVGFAIKSPSVSMVLDADKNVTTKLTGSVFNYNVSNNIKAFLFDNGKDQIIVNQKYIKYFAGYDFYYYNAVSPIVVKDKNNNFIGYILTIKPAKSEKIDTSNLELAKIKGFNQETPTPKLDTEVASEEETVEANVDDTSYEETENTPSKYPGTTPSDKTANALIDTYLSKGQKFTSNDLYNICDETFGGTQAEGKYDRKDAYDAMELAVNKRIVEVMKGYNTGKVDNAIEGLRRMQALLDLLPTQTVRTEEQEQYQQFSTPPNIAYLASWVANINSKDHMMEPSAGIGGIASFAKSWGAMVTVNELSKRRYGVLKAMGFDNMFNENAEHINNILPDSIQPSVVVMNPPFSSTAGRTKTNKTSNAELHINSALDRLGEGGRLVAILGRGMADDKYSKYWNKIRENYTIRANISIDGSNYKKYGTTFDIQLVIIDKIGPQKGKTFTAVYEDLSKVPSALEGIRNERSTEVKFSTIVASNQGDSVPAERDGVVSVSMDSAGNSNDGSGALSNGTEQRDTGESGGNNLQPGVSDGVSEHNQLTDTQHDTNDKSDTENSVSKDGKADRNTVSEVTGNDSTKSSDERSGLGDDSTRSTEIGRSDKRNDDGVFAEYVAPKIPTKGSKPHPAVLVESSAMSSVEMPPAVYKPHLPENVIKNNLSSEQMVTITYAGQSHEQKLPNGMRKGFFIGDGTGVGKGRQISGIILDNFEQGRKRAVWISKTDKLYNEAVSDWVDTTGRSAKEVYNFGKIKLGDKIDIKEGILFATYDSLRSEKGEKSRLNQIVDWLGKDFDGVIAFDEAHNMANAGADTGAWGKTKGSAKALKAIELQNKLPNARVVYASATAATEVSNLAYTERLGLWGEGTAFPNKNDFISKIGSAGLSAMELVVRDMKAMGVYVARSISYNGVSYDTVEHNLDGIQTEIYNTMCRAWQSVMDNVLKSLEETNANKNAAARRNARGQFYSAMQRFYNQVLTSMSMPSVIKDIKKQLDDGKSVVIQLVNTNQAQADREIAEIKASNGSLDDMDLTPRGQLIEYLNNCFPVNLYEDVTDENGHTTSQLVKDSQGNPVVDKKAVKRRDELIALVNDMSIPDGPLEMLFDVFGTENVAEVTGRSRRVVPKKMKDGSIHRVEESRTKAHTEADVSAFNDGKKRILVFSDAGGTGKSYHASRKIKNQQQRVHYVLQPGWSASNAVQGFGRTNRSNQSSAPIYKLVTTNIKGQKRFTSTIARRLDQLGALTKGQRDSGSGMFGAKDNLETDLARDALREFYSRLIKKQIPGLDRYDIIKKLGLLNKFTDQYGSFKLDDSAARDMGLFLNRILSLEVDEQNRVFDEFTNIYDFMLDKAIQSGTLDTGMENVKADKIEIVDSEVISKQKGTGAETKYVQAKVYTKPDVIDTVERAKNYWFGKSFIGIYKTESGEYKAVYRIADKTTQYGDVQKQYVVFGPNTAKHSTWIENTLNAKATPVPEEEWEKAWAEEVKKVPEYNEEIKHMLTGALLPIWNKLPSEGNTKVQRITADNGETYLGRIIEPDIIDGILRVFGANRTKETFSADKVKNGALNEGKTYNLTYYNAKIKRSRVSDEWRLEYIQPKNQFAILSTYPGMIKEKISWTDRFFIPQNEQGEKILEKILENNPVAYVGDEDTQYQLRNYLDDNIEKEYWEVASMIAELYDSYDPYDYMDQMTGYEDVTIAEQLKSGDFSIIDRVKEEYEEYTDDEKRIADDIIRRAEELQGTQYQSRSYIEYSKKDLLSKDFYQYDNLVSLPDMKVVDVNADNKYKKLPEVKDRKQIKKIVKENINVHNSMPLDNVNTKLYNKYLKSDVGVGKEGINHGLQFYTDSENINAEERLQGELNAEAIVNLPLYFEEAIPINLAIPGRNSADRSFVLIGMYRKGDEYRIVRILVNSKDTEIESIETLYALQGKEHKKEEASVETDSLYDKMPLGITSSMVSIKAVLDFVKDKFPNQLSESVLDHYNLVRGYSDIENIQFQSRGYLKETDSEGRELSKGQADYFENSQNRDDEGNLKQMFHGTPNGGFTIFEPGNSDDNMSLFFTDSKEVAKSYSGFDHIWKEKHETTLEELRQYWKDGRGADIIDNGDGTYTTETDDAWEDTFDSYDELEEYILDDFRAYNDMPYGSEPLIYPVYLNCENPLIVDGKGADWNNIIFDFSQGKMGEILSKINALEKKNDMRKPADWSRADWSKEDNAEYDKLAEEYEKLENKYNNYDSSTRGIVKYAYENGYDSVIFKDIYDIGNYGGSLHKKSTVVAVFHSEQVKAISNLNPTKHKDIQYQSRREANESLTNTEVLEMAVDRVEAMNLSEGEKFALETFKKRLSDLDDLQKERQEQGKLWKEQQFGANADSAKATETLNRMHILDEKIKKAEADLLSLEEKDVLKKVLEKARKVIEQEDRAKSQEMLKRYRERKRNTESIKKYRDRIKEDVEELSSWITKPDVKKGKMVPDALKDSVIDFLTSIDFTSKRGLKGGAATKADVEFVKRIEKLKGSIKAQIDLNGMYSGYNDLPEGFMDDLQRFIDNTRKITEQHSGDYVINQMTAEELKELSKVVKVLKSYVTMMNAFHKNAMYQHVEDAGEDTLSYLKKSGKAQNVGEISNYVFWENIRPAFAWERFGKGGKAIYDELVDGQAKLAFNALQVKEFTNGNKEKGIEAAYTEEEVKEWTEKSNEFTIGNDKVSIPIAYIMGIYELYQQEASFKHMISDKGGIRIATYKNGKTKFSDDGHFVDKAKLDEIIGSLTPRQKEVADKLQQFMEKVGGPWGNYVSVARFGIELFTTPHYYPINSDGRHLDNNFEEFPNNASLYALLNASFTKSRIEEANNRIVIYSIFDVFANHMASMAQYNAFALPILDAIKWFNYKESWTGPDGKRQVGRSIREELTKVYGVPEESKPGKGNEGYAVSFIKNIIKAFNGTETQGSPKDTLGIKLLHQHNMAQIAYNLRVVVQQPMSVLRAGLVIDYSSIIKGMQMTPQKAKETLAEMNKYNGIAVWKNELGFYDTNISRGLTSLIKHDKTTLEKINEFGMVGAELADKITWAAMWNACKYEVVRRGTSESDPKFFDKVNALFNEVIYKTQVVDSVLTKTEFMRDKGYWGKAMSSFMSEAVTTASALTDAMFNYFMDLQRGMSRSQAWQKHSKNFGKVVAVYSISAILLAAIQAVMDALRDDDEDESYFEKWGDAFIGNVIDELMPFNKLPIFSDFYDLAKELLSKLGVDTYGNPPTSIFMQYWDSLVNGVGILHDKINGSNKGYTWYGGIKKLLQAASSITGAPLGNITREVVTFWNNTAGALSDNLIVHSYVSGNQEMNKYFNALDSGDTREANKIYSEIIEEKKKDFAESREKEGKTELSDAELESKAKSSVKTSITSHYKEIYVEAYKSKDTDKMAEIRKKLYQTGLYGSVDDVVKTCNKWLSEYK